MPIPRDHALIVRWTPANPYWWGNHRYMYWYHSTLNGVHY